MKYKFYFMEYLQQVSSCGLKLLFMLVIGTCEGGSFSELDVSIERIFIYSCRGISTSTCCILSYHKYSIIFLYFRM